MQNKSVPEPKESTTEELADNDSEVFEHHEDEVALQEDTMVQQLQAVSLDVHSGHLKHIIAY